MPSIAIVRSVVVFAAIGLAECNAQAPQQSAIPTRLPVKASTPDQQHLCDVHDWERDATAAACVAGQKIVFLPDHFGNEQLPILFAASNCDLRDTVALTDGGVTCVYNPSLTQAIKR